MSTMKGWKRNIDPTSKTEEIFFENGDTLPAHFNVDSRDIKEGKRIGKGIWTVHEAKWLGRKVAVKKFVAESTFSNVSLTSREVNRMLNLRHPNILKLLGFYLTTQKDLVLECSMIMELMDFDLEDYIGRGPLLDDQVVYLFAEVARGMYHIHNKGCFHRDLKPKNVLLRKSVVTRFHVDVKIADFGSSELVCGGNIDPKAGTLGYKAPEQFDPTPELFLDKVDVFGFGALCFKILTGKKPYESHRNVREAVKQLGRSTLSQRNLPKDVEMIWKCLDVNPELRPDFWKISGILDGALLAIQEKMPRPLASSTSASLYSTEFMTKGFRGHDQFKSILQGMGLSKEYGVHFIPFEELVVLQAIGSGSYARVYKVEWKGISYALKIFDKHDTYAFIGYFMEKTYFRTYPKLLHKNIVTFMGYSITPNERISILMKLQAIDLSSALLPRENKPTLNIEKKLFVVREIAEGMKYLHDQEVVHGDLKPSNVMLSALNTKEMTVKLIDFANDDKTFTTRYDAPECSQKMLLRSRNYIDVKKSDVYSFGILCQEILTGVLLFGNFSLEERHEAILRGKRPQIPIGTSLEMESLMKRCSSRDPQERPDFTEVCKKLSGIQLYQSYEKDYNPKHFSLKCCLL